MIKIYNINRLILKSSHLTAISSLTKCLCCQTRHISNDVKAQPENSRKTTFYKLLSPPRPIADAFSNARCFSSNVKPDDDGKVEVYYGVLTPQIRGVKVFSLLSSLSGIVAQPILYQKVTEYGGGVTIMVALGSFIGFFTFVTPFLLHLITRKYVTRIVYCEKEDKYTLTTLSFFLRRKSIDFTPADVEIPDVPGMFTVFTVKGKPVFVDSQQFPDVSHYVRIMGFDKPIDFKLATPDTMPEKRDQ